MLLSHGGRVTLRLGSVTSTAAEYSGELETAETTFRTELAVGVEDGAIAVHAGTDAPPWLLELARVTLRAAWRATRTGAEWPRRVSRWRPAKDAPED